MRFCHLTFNLCVSHTLHAHPWNHWYAQGRTRVINCPHQCVLAFITHTYYVYTALIWWIWYKKVTFIHIFFKIAIYFIALMNLGKICHLKGHGMANGVVAMLLRLWQRATPLWRHTVWIRIVTSHNAWMGYEYSLPNFNRTRAIHKHNPNPLKTMGLVWQIYATFLILANV